MDVSEGTGVVKRPSAVVIALEIAGKSTVGLRFAAILVVFPNVVWRICACSARPGSLSAGTGNGVEVGTHASEGTSGQYGGHGEIWNFCRIVFRSYCNNGIAIPHKCRSTRPVAMGKGPTGIFPMLSEQLR